MVNSALSRPTCSDCAAVASIRPALRCCFVLAANRCTCPVKTNSPLPGTVQTQRNTNLKISSNLHTRNLPNQLPFESNNRAQFSRLHPLSQAQFTAKNRLQWLDGLCCAPHSSPQPFSYHHQPHPTIIPTTQHCLSTPAGLLG